MIAVTRVIAETNGFLLFNSIRQLVSYAGLDVTQDQSGQYKGKSRLSKKGNAHLREALYMPALCAATHNENLKAFYFRLNEKFNHKKQSLVAVMRKLLILIYTLWKSGQEYNPQHQWQEKRREASLPPLDSH
ncbi:transposase [Galbibacter sp. EGI 63066]|uniref:transposase n=1 Tax=Galbibacter sp. EGI 63066 TaxID=2993559 RepID=UPI002248E6CB|nr:transposase [Galbibacter sp. EGI 63066]MCX2679113.1 transposase [Galbibacter sp. EGI 63066]